jgi:SAM-dependent methyltransferase
MVKNTGERQYGKFAEVYDKLDADRHSRLMADYTLRIIDKFGIEVKDVLDLCCGTGSAVKAFAEHGFVMAGLDQSRHMLAVAREKLRGRGIKLYQRSLPKFDIRLPGKAKEVRQFDLVTSFFDSLNYMLSARDLKTAFRSVARHVKPGGWFVFDMNTPHGLRYVWSDYKHASDGKDLVSIWINDYDEQSGLASCHVGLFLKKRGKLWERFDEMHYERGYTNGQIRKMLRETGCTVREVYRCGRFEKPDNTTNRICVVAQRKG